jgi:asparagine synthase (glutamine-hydrolysing)
MNLGFVIRINSPGAPIGPLRVRRSTGGQLFSGRGVSGLVTADSTTPEALTEEQPLISDRTLVLYSGHVDNRSDLAAALDAPSMAEASDGAVLLAAADKWGARLQQRVTGDYGFVAVDIKDATVVAGRDGLGVKRVYYYAGEGSITISSSLRLLLASLEVTPRLDPDGVAEFIRCGELAATRTVFSRVHIVPPGSSVIWRSAQIRIIESWSPPFGPELTSSNKNLEEQCRALVTAGVAAALRSRRRVCIELSGGLDSSTVACLADRLWTAGSGLGDPPVTVSYIRRLDQTSDETAYREAVSQSCSFSNHTIDIGEFGAFSPFVGDVPCEPLFHMADPAKYCAIRNLQGRLQLRTCLTGCGGDEVFAGGFDQPYFLRDWFRQLRWRRWIAGIRSYMEAGRGNLFGLCSLSLSHGLRGKQTHRPRWLTVGDKDVPLGYYYARLIPSDGRMFYPAQAMQLAAVRSAALSHTRPFGWDERHPLLFRPLVEFMLRVPWSLKTSAHGGRGLHRGAMMGILPERVRTRTGKGRADHNILRDFSRSKRAIQPLSSGKLLGDHSIVNTSLFYRACERLSHGHVTPNESYLDLWNALVLERWLQLNGPAQSDRARVQYRRLWQDATEDLAPVRIRNYSASG